MDYPRRILVLPFYFLPEVWNGIDEHLLLLSRLNPSKYQLAVLCQANDGPQTQTLAKRAGIELLTAPYEPGTPGPQRCLRLRRLLRAQRFTVLHMHSPVAGGQFWPALAAKMAGVKTAVTYHQVQPWRMPLKTRLLNRFTHSRLVDRTIAVSGAVQRTLQTSAGLLEPQLEIISNAIDLTPQTEEAGDTLPRMPVGAIRLGYFGRLSPEKGLAILLQGMALIPASRRAHLFLAGDGPQREELVSLARTLKIEERVTFLGFRSDARALMTQMDAVIHVPEYEGFGLVILEAMAAGRALIVNDAPGGMTELVSDGVNGLVVPAGSPGRLASAIETLAVDESLRSYLGANGLKICSERYAAPLFGERMERLYDGLFDPSIDDPLAAGPGKQPDMLAGNARTN
jgi:glycosyltransferase involved in cell wall biosynthesis